MYIVGIDENTCYCTFTINNGEYIIGQHNISFKAILNDEVHGSTTISFHVSDSEYH